MTYRGRFAPSPSGHLHFGSLVCALASYLDARQQGGEWLVRIEDIDPPREVSGAAASILGTLQKHGLHWDGEVLFQSSRSRAYNETLQKLSSLNLTYSCDCSRKRLSDLKGIYDGRCSHALTPTNSPSATRLRITTTSSIVSFLDRVKGQQTEDLSETSGDFTIHRRDGLFAYQLAVVVDDIAQGITDIVRGDDLLDTTAKQIFLTLHLKAAAPSYAHIPVVLGSNGYKLSKQNHAPAVCNELAAHNLIRALNQLKVTTPSGLESRSLTEILSYGCEHFSLKRLSQKF